MNLLTPLESGLASALGLPAAAGAPALGASLAYAGTAVLCALVARKPPPAAVAAGQLSTRRAALFSPQADAWLWQLAALMLLVLALNCLVHGERLLILWLRELAGQQGWYESRRLFQGGLLGVAVPLAALAAWHGLRWARAEGLRGPGAWLLGSLGSLCAYTALRLVSLHHTDLLFDAHIAGASVGRWIELLSLAVAVSAALIRLRSAPAAHLREFPHV